MEYVVIKKENGKITTFTRTKEMDDTAYLNAKEKGLIGKFSNKFNQLSRKNVDSCRIAINDIVNKLFYTRTIGPKINDLLYDQLKQIKTKDDLVGVYNTLSFAYKEVFSKKRQQETEKALNKLQTEFEKNPELFLSIMTKKLIAANNTRKITEQGKQKIDELEDMKIKKATADEIIKAIGDNFDEISEKNGIKSLSTKIYLDLIDTLYDQYQIHCCWDNCANATPSRCPKVQAIVKENIDQYDIIKNGYQVYKDGKLIKFIVTDCKLKQKKEQKKYTKKQINQMTGELAQLYVDAATIPEASEILTQLRNRKAIEEPIAHFKVTKSRV